MHTYNKMINEYSINNKTKNYIKDMKKDSDKNKLNKEKDISSEARRDFLHVASGAVGVVGAGIAGWPLIDQMNPSADVKALASIEVDLSGLQEGKSLTLMWRGKPLFIRHRTNDEIKEASEVDIKILPDPVADKERVKNPKYLIMVGVCTHLGCVPIADQGEYKGWFCPCHGSHYDTSGRIRKGPAPSNLEIPPYEFISDTKVKVG